MNIQELMRESSERGKVLVNRKVEFTEVFYPNRCVSKSKATCQGKGDRTGNILNTSTLVLPISNNCVHFPNDLIPSSSFEFDTNKRTLKRLPSDFDDAQEKEFKDDWGIPHWN